MLNAEKKYAFIIKRLNKNLDSGLVKKIMTSAYPWSYIEIKFKVNQNINGISKAPLILRKIHFFVAIII